LLSLFAVLVLRDS